MKAVPIRCVYQVLRDGQWKEQDAAVLVPGDIISIKFGDVIPADARLLEGDPLKIDQASITNEGTSRFYPYCTFCTSIYHL